MKAIIALSREVRLVKSILKNLHDEIKGVRQIVAGAILTMGFFRGLDCNQVLNMFWVISRAPLSLMSVTSPVFDQVMKYG